MRRLLRRDLIWHRPCRLAPRTQRFIVLALRRASLLSRWEFRFAAGRERQHSTGERGLFWLQSIICKPSRRGRIEEVRQTDQYTLFHNKHVEYVWAQAASCYSPQLLIEWHVWCRALAGISYPSYTTPFGRKTWALHPRHRDSCISYWFKITLEGVGVKFP